MRFDPARVVSESAALAGRREPFSEREAAVHNQVAADLETAGWRVERHSSAFFWSRGDLAASAVAGLLLVAWWSYLIRCFEPSLSGWPALGGSVVLVLTIAVAFGRRYLRLRRRFDAHPPVHLWARLPNDAPRPARLVLVACSRPTPPTWVVLGTMLACGLAFLPAVRILVGWTSARAGSIWLLLLLVVEWLVLLVPVAGWLDRFERFRPHGDNRAGLALLTELARTWPRSCRERLQTWMLVTPSPVEGARFIEEAVGDGVPTLILVLDSPSVGPELILAGGGPGAELLYDAARSLRIPLSWRGSGKVRGVRAMQLVKGATAGLGGRKDDWSPDPALLNAAAQLTIEAAMRWGRNPQRPTDGALSRSD